MPSGRVHGIKLARVAYENNESNNVKNDSSSYRCHEDLPASLNGYLPVRNDPRVGAQYWYTSVKISDWGHTCGDSRLVVGSHSERDASLTVCRQCEPPFGKSVECWRRHVRIVVPDTSPAIIILVHSGVQALISAAQLVKVGRGTYQQG